MPGTRRVSFKMEHKGGDFGVIVNDISATKKGAAALEKHLPGIAEGLDANIQIVVHDRKSSVGAFNVTQEAWDAIFKTAARKEQLP